MTLKIMKLAVTASAETVIAPTVSRFFYQVGTTVTGKATLTIDAANFVNDTGGIVEELPELTTSNSYVEIYINGVLQMDAVFTYTPGGTGTGQLAINIPDGSTIEESSPVVLVIANFAPTTTVDITT